MNFRRFSNLIQLLINECILLNYRNENNLNKTREDIRLPFNLIGNKIVKTETKSSSLNEYFDKSDNAYVDYTSNGERKILINQKVKHFAIILSFLLR